MIIEQLWVELGRLGVDVPESVQRQIGLAHNQERVLLRPPAPPPAKARVLHYGTATPATYIARELGITVRQVRKVRRLMR